MLCAQVPFLGGASQACVSEASDCDGATFGSNHLPWNMCLCRLASGWCCGVELAGLSFKECIGVAGLLNPHPSIICMLKQQSMMMLQMSRCEAARGLSTA